MSPQPNVPDRIADELQRFRESLSRLESKFTEASTNIGWLKRDLRVLGACSLAALGMLMSWYIPKEAQGDLPRDAAKKVDSIPDDFATKFAKLQDSVEGINEKYGRIVPSSLNQLIPDPNEPLSSGVAIKRLTRADNVILSAFKLELSAKPALLKAVVQRAQALGSNNPNDDRYQIAVMSTRAHLAAYETFSDATFGSSASFDKEPQNVTLTRAQAAFPLPSPVSTQTANNVSLLANLTINCDYKTVQFLKVQPLGEVLVYSVRVRNCGQEITRINWVNGDFDSATLVYRGGPLTIVNTTFKDCAFDFGDDSRSAHVKAQIQAANGKPVSIYLR